MRNNTTACPSSNGTNYERLFIVRRGPIGQASADAHRRIDSTGQGVPFMLSHRALIRSVFSWIKLKASAWG